MNLVTLSGQPVIDMRLALPLAGAWHADVSVDSQEELTGQVTLKVDGNAFVGTVRRGGVVADTGTYRLVGGAGGLAKSARAKAYNNATVQLVLQDILGDAGESLSPTVSPSLLSLVLPFWVTRAAPTAYALGELVEALGGDVVWRVLPDGSIWLGVETWPVVRPEAVAVRRIDARLGKADVVLGPAAMVLPGTALQSAETRVSYVLLGLQGAHRVVAEVWLE